MENLLFIVILVQNMSHILKIYMLLICKAWGMLFYLNII